jgi:hypothetical protein
MVGVLVAVGSFDLPILESCLYVCTWLLLVSKAVQ